MTDEDAPPIPDRTTAYSLPALSAAYGARPLRTERFEVSSEKYEAVQAEERRDELGGARVLVRRREERATLLVSNRGEHGWDIPGGAREAGECPEETAIRECYEETGLRISLRDLLRVHEFTFLPASGAPGVAGLWLQFEGIPTDDPGSFTIDTEELDDGAWMDSPPPELDRYAAPAVRAYLPPDG